MLIKITFTLVFQINIQKLKVCKNIQNKICPSEFSKSQNAVITDAQYVPIFIKGKIIVLINI